MNMGNMGKDEPVDRRKSRHDRRRDRGDDRRAYKRFSKNFILTYHDIAAPDVKYSASQLRDISKGGMCLITDRAFPQGSRVAVQLKTPFYSELMYLEGMVIQSKEKIRDVIYETHLKFDETSGQSLLILDKLIEHFQHEESHDSE